MPARKQTKREVGFAEFLKEHRDWVLQDPVMAYHTHQLGIATEWVEFGKSFRYYDGLRRRVGRCQAWEQLMCSLQSLYAGWPASSLVLKGGQWLRVYRGIYRSEHGGLTLRHDTARLLSRWTGKQPLIPTVMRGLLRTAWCSPDGSSGTSLRARKATASLLGKDFQQLSLPLGF